MLAVRVWPSYETRVATERQREAPPCHVGGAKSHVDASTEDQPVRNRFHRNMIIIHFLFINFFYQTYIATREHGVDAFMLCFS